MERISELVEVRPNRRIHIERFMHTHSAAPTLLFLYGSSGRAEHWRKILPHFSDKCNCVIPSYLGHGQSDKPSFTVGQFNPYAFMQMVRDIEVVLKKYGDTNGNTIIFGHSMGAKIALRLACQYPNKIKKLILLCPGTFEESDDSSDLWSQPIEELEAKRSDMAEVFQYMAFEEDTDPALLKQEAKAARDVPMHVVQGLNLNESDKPIDLASIKIPTLILTGESDLLITDKEIRAAYSHIPHVHIKKITKAGHFIMLEQPEEVMRCIDSFL